MSIRIPLPDHDLYAELRRYQVDDATGWQLHMYDTQSSQRLLLGSSCQMPHSGNSAVGLRRDEHMGDIVPERNRHMVACYAYVGALAAMSARHTVYVDPLHTTPSGVETDGLLADILEDVGFAYLPQGPLSAMAGPLRDVLMPQFPAQFAELTW